MLGADDCKYPNSRGKFLDTNNIDMIIAAMVFLSYLTRIHGRRVANNFHLASIDGLSC
jgi:hypothetical protein